MEQTGWPFAVAAEQIFDFFKSPPVGEYKIEFRAPDNEALIRLLCDEHDFSRERVETALARIGGPGKVSKAKSKKSESAALSAFVKKS